MSKKPTKSGPATAARRAAALKSLEKTAGQVAARWVDATEAYRSICKRDVLVDMVRDEIVRRIIEYERLLEFNSITQATNHKTVDKRKEELDKKIRDAEQFVTFLQRRDTLHELRLSRGYFSAYVPCEDDNADSSLPPCAWRQVHDDIEALERLLDDLRAISKDFDQNYTEMLEEQKRLSQRKPAPRHLYETAVTIWGIQLRQERETPAGKRDFKEFYSKLVELAERFAGIEPEKRTKPGALDKRLSRHRSGQA